MPESEKVNGKDDLEWLVPVSLLIAGTLLTFMVGPTALEQAGVMDQELARGLTTLFGITLTLPTLFFGAVTTLISIRALVWGRRRLKGRILLWYACLATVLLMLWMERSVPTTVGCVGLVTLLLLPGVWLSTRPRGRCRHSA